MNYDLFEELIAEYSSESLNEKWYQWDSVVQGAWYSDSISQFRAFLQNAASTGITGLRVCLRPGCYLAVKAAEASHTMLIDFAKQNYLVDPTLKYTDFEMFTCGFPKCADFTTSNIDTLMPGYKPFTYETIIADCGTFEADLYFFESKQFPDFVNPSAQKWLGKAINLETSETYRALKPLITDIRVDKATK
jgi:hypothetical protein